MGRHARGAARSEGLGVDSAARMLIVVVIAVGSWLGSRAHRRRSRRAQTTGSAVVVSSLACTEGAGGTLVDVLVPSGLPVRTSLDTCGHQEGELLAVSYAAGDPAAAWMARPGLDRRHTDRFAADRARGGRTARRVRVFAVWFDGRRQRRRAVSDVPAAHGSGGVRVHDGDVDVGMAPLPNDTAELRRDQPEQPTGRHALPDPVQDSAPVVVRDDRRLSSVDLAFPFTSSLAASLHDELFTHRSVTT